MNDRERNRFDALKRVKKFKEDHATDFPATGSPANVKSTALFGTIATTVANVEDAIEGRATAEAGYHGGTTTETVKRNALMLDLAELNRAAAAIAEADGTPGLMESFRMPWGESDVELPGKARAIIAAAGAISTKLIELDFATNFAALLEARVVDFETAGGAQDASLAQQAGFTGAFDDLLAPGLTALKQLDVICRRRFRSDAVKLGAWSTASHIERQSSGGGGNGGGETEVPAKAVIGSMDLGQDNNQHIGSMTAEGADHFEVQHKAVADTDWTTDSTNAPGSDFHFGVLPPGDYLTRVRGVNEAGPGEWSDELPFTLS